MIHKKPNFDVKEVQCFIESRSSLPLGFGLSLGETGASSNITLDKFYNETETVKTCKVNLILIAKKCGSNGPEHSITFKIILTDGRIFEHTLGGLYYAEHKHESGKKQKEFYRTENNHLVLMNNQWTIQEIVA